MALPPIYKIHPAIGIARVGNADRDTFFIGPEFPGRGPMGDPSVGTRVPNFKDSGKLKPQAARFRVWEYVDNKGKYEPSREINLKERDCVSLEWTVHLANRKASFFKFKYLAGEERRHASGPRRNDAIIERRKLELDPLPRSISGRSMGPVEFRKGNSRHPARELWPDPAPSPPIEYLGELRTDAEGRLIVLGGKGLSSALPGKPLNDTFNNDGWFDDVSDGPVTARLVLRGPGKKNKVVPVEGAWLLCGPPDFAPSLTNQVTLYDVLYDMAAREMVLPKNEALYDTTLKPLAEINAEFKASGGPKLSKYKPTFDTEIFPILRRAVEHFFVIEVLKSPPFHDKLKTPAQLGDPSAASQAKRQEVFDRIHPPGLAGKGGSKNMPMQQGDEPFNDAHKRRALTVTETQFALLEQWAKGNFVATAGKLPPPPPPATVTPEGLDRAALENCVGGAFAVGIEVSWQIRNKKLFVGPFRINHKATSKYLGDVGVDAGQIRAGHFSRQMSLPWQTDFLACAFQDGMAWWPAQRPDITYASKSDFDATPKKSQNWTRASSGGTTANWPNGRATPTRKEFTEHFYKLGIVWEDQRFYHLERERDPNVP